MSSPRTPSSLRNLSDTDLVFCTFAVAAAAITIGCLLYAEIAVGSYRRAVLAYSALQLVLQAGAVTIIVKLPRARIAGYVAAVILGLEAVVSAKFLVVDNTHHVATARDNQARWAAIEASSERFVFHPLLGVALTPGYDNGVLSHDSDGRRTTIGPSAAEAPTIAVIGGSTTYNYHVADELTWESHLAGLTGLHVENLGVSGYSSSAHVIQTAFQLAGLDPVCAIYYVGWNDLRSTGVTNLEPDYSNFTARTKYSDVPDIPNSFKLIRFSALEYSAIAFEVVNTLRVRLDAALHGMKDALFAEHVITEIRSEADPETLAYFLDNMRNIIAMNQARGIKTILIPQVLYAPALDDDEVGGWVPFIPHRDIPTVMDAYNEALVALAEADGDSDGVWAIDDVLEAGWSAEHFVDEGHFTEAGTRLFAETIAPGVSEICGPAPER